MVARRTTPPSATPPKVSGFGKGFRVASSDPIFAPSRSNFASSRSILGVVATEFGLGGNG
jgi:hypothetical protein